MTRRVRGSKPYKVRRADPAARVRDPGTGRPMDPAAAWVALPDPVWASVQPLSAREARLLKEGERVEDRRTCWTYERLRVASDRTNPATLGDRFEIGADLFEVRGLDEVDHPGREVLKYNLEIVPRDENERGDP